MHFWPLPYCVLGVVFQKFRLNTTDNLEFGNTKNDVLRNKISKYFSNVTNTEREKERHSSEFLEEIVNEKENCV